MKKLTVLLFTSILLLGNISAQDFEYNPKEYGVGNSIGLSLLGDGVIGMAFKFIQANQNQWDLNASYTGRLEVFTFDDTFEIGDYDHGISLTGGYNIFMGSNYKWSKHKVIKNYIAPRLSFTYRDQEEVGVGFVWHRQAFRPDEQNYSRGFDLGLSYKKILGNGFYLNTNGDPIDSYVSIFIRVDWNWFRQKY